ncbi:hypothetical protein [Georgenia yuyongxinii]
MRASALVRPVLDGGRVAELGDHETLAAAGGRYTALRAAGERAAGERALSTA